MSPEEEILAASMVGTTDDRLATSKDHVDALIKDHKHFTARWLAVVKARTGLATEGTMALVALTVFCIWLSFAEEAGFAANAVLVGVPLLLTLFYPEEKANSEEMLIYWSCYSVLTLFDPLLSTVPCWFVLKLGLFSLFFLRPWNFALRIRLLLFLREVRRRGARSSSNQRQQKKALPPRRATPLQSSTSTSAVTSSATEKPRNLYPKESAHAKPDSRYFDLRPKSKTTLVNPTPSVYAGVRSGGGSSKK